MEILSKIIMLPTKKPSPLVMNCDGDLEYDDILSTYCGVEQQHLYICSYDDVKKGDLCIVEQDGKKEVGKCTKIGNGGLHYFEELSSPFNETCAPSYRKCMKIIATTDKKLGWSNLGTDDEGTVIGNSYLGVGITFYPIFPTPSEAFMNEYIKLNGMCDDVYIEYEEQFITIGNNFHNHKESNGYKIKINRDDNTVNLSFAKNENFLSKIAEELYIKWFGSPNHTTRRSPSKKNIIQYAIEVAKLTLK